MPSLEERSPLAPQYGGNTAAGEFRGPTAQHGAGLLIGGLILGSLFLVSSLVAFVVYIRYIQGGNYSDVPFLVADSYQLLEAGVSLIALVTAIIGAVLDRGRHRTLTNAALVVTGVGFGFGALTLPYVFISP